MFKFSLTGALSPMRRAHIRSLPFEDNGFADANESTNSDLFDFQLKKLNFVWQHVCKKYRFYKERKEELHLPSCITDADSLLKLPPVHKHEVAGKLHEIMADEPAISIASTGGSSGRPTSIATGPLRRRRAKANLWHARFRYGVSPGAPILHVWGHSHLFGAGFGRYFHRTKRAVFDRASNIKRYAAYNYETDHFAKVFEEIVSGNFELLIGYSHWLLEFAKFCEGEGLNEAARGKLKLIVPTAEMISLADARYLSSVFSCDCVPEYGAMEFGPLAYMISNQGYSGLSKSFLFERDNDSNLLISDLSCVEFPLIRYRIGDLVIEDNFCSDRFQILGRANDTVELRGNAGETLRVHSELFTHILKQFVLDGFYVEARRSACHIYAWGKDADGDTFSKRFIDYFRLEFPSVDTSFFDFHFEQKVDLSIAGKRRFVVSYDED